MNDLRGKWRVPFQYNAAEAHMTQQTNQRDLPVRIAGHQIGTALYQPLPSSVSILSGWYKPGTTWIRPKNENKEERMNAITEKRANIASVILRVSLGLLLWTIGASAMDLRIEPVPAKEHRVVIDLRADRAQIENLQRWVNAGHDPWCLDSQLVAAATLRRVSREPAGYEPASLTPEVERTENTKMIYTFHALGGRTRYRITLRRHLYLLRSAGSLRRIIWTPETAEITTTDARD
jgi:hypothetical protein